MSPYYRRFIFISLILALITAALAIWQPSIRARVASTSPHGDQVPVTTSIRITFTDEIDRAIIERSFRVAPAVPGEVSWQQDTLVFTPSRPLTPTQDYRVTLAPASARAVGTAPLSWNFRTRAQRLFYIDETGLWMVDEKPARRVIAAKGITSFTLSPDGEQIAYSLRRDDEREALLLFSLRDSTTKTVSDTPNERASQPDWSPANDFIAYTSSTRSGSTWQPSGIWLAQTDGTPLGPLALGLTGESPRFTSGAQRLAFLNGSALTVVSLSGAGGAQASDVRGPFAWSPDGSKIAYISTQLQVHTIDLTTHSVQPIAAANATALGWLPDGQLVIGFGGAVVIFGSDGTASAPATLCVAPIRSLAIAADGTMAAVCATQGQQAHIVTAALRDLTPVMVGTGTQPQWAP